MPVPDNRRESTVKRCLLSALWSVRQRRRWSGKTSKAHRRRTHFRLRGNKDLVNYTCRKWFIVRTQQKMRLQLISTTVFCGFSDRRCTENGHRISSTILKFETKSPRLINNTVRAVEYSLACNVVLYAVRRTKIINEPSSKNY